MTDPVKTQPLNATGGGGSTRAGVPPSTAATASAAGPTAPAKIRKLDENVVNKIAAGEVIQRPASALKEMLENSLDAGSTQISISVKEGGNKLLQITDNGSGIRKQDLAILCHRHTTSKLASFEDLETLSTLGFRGEALCSISFVSHMTVTTMARGATYGYRVTYKDSEVEAPGPKPVAAVPGTTITVEDLFYNVPTRRKALRSASEEYGLILDVVGRYAVYSAGVAFAVRRHGDARADIVTAAGGSRLDAVRAVYGADVARELLPLRLEAGGGTGADVPVDGPMGLRVEGLISGANYTSGKKAVLVLFINGRCVECAPLRRTLEGLYGTLLPKASKPWLFLDVRMPPRQVEVNMHPTKREVGFMHQTEVIEAIRAAVESQLLASNESRTFATATPGAGGALTQTQLPFAPLTSGPGLGSAGAGSTGAGPGTSGGAKGQPGSQDGGEEEDGDDDEDEEDEGEEGEEDEDADGEGEEAAPANARRRGSNAGASGAGRRKGAAAPQAAAGAGAKRARGGGGTAPVPYRPEKLVRVDYRTGTLDSFVVRKPAPAPPSAPASNNPPSTSSAPADGPGPSTAAAAARAAAAGGSVARKRSAAGRPGSGLGALDGEGGGGGEWRASGRRLPPGLITAEVLGIGPLVTLGDGGKDNAGDEDNEGDDGLGDGEELVTAAADGEGEAGDAAAGTAGRRAGAGAAGPRPRRTAPPVVTRDPEVLALLAEAEAGAHGGLGELLREHTFVGVADGSLALLQSGTRLYLVDVGALAGDMLYQLALRRWDQPLRVALDPPPCVGELVELGLSLLEAKGEWRPEDGSPQELAGLVTELLQQKRPALERSLGLAVDEQGRLASVPQLLEGLPPDPARLPDLVIALARDVDWEEPRECVRALARAVADLYAARPPLPPDEEEDGDEAELGAAEASGKQAPEKPGADPSQAAASARRQRAAEAREQQLAEYEQRLRNLVLPALRGCLRPPRERATDGSVVQVAALERLYRIFERC
ncbi:hypothetical protein HYH03_005783 [Edaphochlamys debaryana]|uniref:DNA mismatch repair protein S5 domain-containing protein n=1 Tax=Edaphochlamys debaryana TaxID=47281 RepID=A0A836C211_9CHLO|nr:hypothetical protein HYH03_005783 [Edaphochlamys debaryana]|eukprot:KAG2496183.1 hypothetical protein HYH03_005783 [Edaphochlamys debaryana]